MKGLLLDARTEKEPSPLSGVTTPSMTLTFLYLIGCYKDGVQLVPEQQPSWALIYLGLEAR